MTTSPTPVESVPALSLEDKSRVFCALLKELIEFRGGGKGQISITSPNGEWLGYHIPPLAAEAIFAERGPKLSEERWAELDRRAADEGSFVSTEEFKTMVVADLEKLRRLEPALSGS